MMKAKVSAVICAISLPVAMALVAAPASARTFMFSQTGFSGGGSVSGTFDAVDVDGNGQISSFAGEVSGYSMSFSGDSMVGNFSHGFGDLFGLVYDLGSGQIGDGAGGDVEGVASNLFGSTGFSYASGLGPTGGFGGSVVDSASGASSVTGELVNVVPEPATWAMLLAGALLLPLMVKRKRT